MREQFGMRHYKMFLRIAALWAVAACLPALAQQQYDVVIVGGTPGGIASAITAARLGHSVALLEYHRHLGGMAASGLGKSDIETREAVGGLFREFVERVYQYYVSKYGADSDNVQKCRDGYYYEPSVAEGIFNQIVRAEPRITVNLNHRLEEVIRTGRRVAGIRAADRSSGEIHEFRGKVFIDATYEGDLAAYAGVRYRLGREGRAEFNELHAGVVYQDPRTRTFLAGTTGVGDRRVQAYTYRLCLTDDPENSHVLQSPPPGYDRNLYAGYLDDLDAGRLQPGRHANTVVRAFSIAEIPNHKFDANMFPRVLSYPFVEENFAYPEASWEERERISLRIRNITLGLFYFMQNDPEVPEEQRQLARRYHLPRDEFLDNNHFPWQLYVREARRIVGEYTLTENDVSLAPGLRRTPIHHDSIAAGEFPIDSMPTRRREEGREVILEGYLLMLDNITRPYQIPYRILLPQDVDGLLVPVAASTTHIGFSTIRLEPTWMALGQAAGVAAHFSITQNKRLRDLEAQRIQKTLLEQDQVLTYFEDLDKSDPAHRAIQFFGTKGFFTDYRARSREPLSRGLAASWIDLALRTVEADLKFGERPPARWADFEPGAEHFAEAAGLAAARIVDWPRAGDRFEPGRGLTRNEFAEWLMRVGGFLGLWNQTGETAAETFLEPHGLGSVRWADLSNRTAGGSDVVWRGEFCRALMLLLEKAGY